MGDNNQISFKLIQIDTEEFAIINDSYSKEDGEIEFLTTIRVGFNNTIGTIIIAPTIQLKQDDRTFLKLTVKCEFEIGDNALNSFTRVESEKYIIPRNFLLHLGVITIGTVRGILHSKTEGTEFNKFIIPSINLTTMIEEDLEFDLKEDEEE